MMRREARITSFDGRADGAKLIQSSRATIAMAAGRIVSLLARDRFP
jgi:hypothetical protein